MTTDTYTTFWDSCCEPITFPIPLNRELYKKRIDKIFKTIMSCQTLEQFEVARDWGYKLFSSEQDRLWIDGLLDYKLHEVNSLIESFDELW